MKTLIKITLPLSLLAAAALPQVAAANDAVQLSSLNVAAFEGKMLYGPKGERLAAVYRVTQDGVAQIILNGKMVSVPAATLTAADGKLSTSLTKRDLLTSR